MKTVSLLQALLFISFCLVTNVWGQKSALTNPDGITIEYYGVDSKESIQRTQMLRDAQSEITVVDNGEEIVFVNSGIYVQFASGSGRRLLIAEGGGVDYFMYPAWSLDGSMIAFAANRLDPRIVDLWVAYADGSDPTLIFIFDQGYYNSFISSISWHHSNEYIMFAIAYNDAQSIDYYFLATIHYTVSNISFGTGFDHTFCQYEPENGSDRYAYTSSGIPGYFNSELRVSNLAGTYTEVWLQNTGVVSGLTHVCWNNPNSIYTIIRFWDQYPNREVLARVDKVGPNYTFTPLIISDLNASIWSPTVSPDRYQMYNAELTTTSLLMYLVTFDQNGNVSNIQSRGTGTYPNWRQAFPLPGQVLLQSPPDGATDVSITPILSWQAVPLASAYKLQVFTMAGALIISIDDIPSTQIQIDPLDYETEYIWVVLSKNYAGYGPISDPFSFTTESLVSVDEEIGQLEFALNQNYPNPFNPSTIIKYEIPELSFVNLKVYDVLGNEIAILVNEEMPAGSYENEFNAKNLPSGIYYYKIQAGDFLETKKMILLR